MPVILLADNYNVTRDDIEQIARLSTIDSERWNQEQAQTIVLGALLVVIALLMLAVTAFECYKMKFFGLSSRLESVESGTNGNNVAILVIFLTCSTGEEDQLVNNLHILSKLQLIIRDWL
ncbi:hypothetical protein KIN20_014636 [Parelaphostrongylus tenuis]|uniref:Uncharacterized protein n=1 Tax=Parelaphostrongylus tenuis TaxID=148309 RepID=A0AAD5MWF9_PARTN|nr:hypothetical protein KIN20_014636 [Parelaphostrongylus tenuis]